MTKLTDSRYKNTKATGKIQKIPDRQGLYLHVTADGKKYWRLAYRFAGKEKLLSFGVYPIITLAEARTKRDETKKLLSDNIDPSLSPFIIHNPLISLIFLTKNKNRSRI